MYTRHPCQRRQWHPIPVLLPRKSHGWRSLVGCSPWGSQRVRHDWATSLSLFTFLHWRRQWQPTPVLLPGKSHGQKSLVGCSPGVAKSRTWLSDFTFTFHFHALEKEMATHSSVFAWRIPGTGSWWAAVYGVAQSRTWLKQLSSSSSSSTLIKFVHHAQLLRVWHLTYIKMFEV